MIKSFIYQKRQLQQKPPFLLLKIAGQPLFFYQRPQVNQILPMTVVNRRKQVNIIFLNYAYC